MPGLKSDSTLRLTGPGPATPPIPRGPEAFGPGPSVPEPTLAVILAGAEQYAKEAYDQLVNLVQRLGVVLPPTGAGGVERDGVIGSALRLRQSSALINEMLAAVCTQV